jgi:transposase
MGYIINMIINGKEYLTIKEISERTGKETNTIKQWFFTHDIKPITKDALYDKSVLDILKNTPGKGRPKKAPAAKGAKKSVKGKK